jgi:hypothetical protein
MLPIAFLVGTLFHGRTAVDTPPPRRTEDTNLTTHVQRVRGEMKRVTRRIYEVPAPDPTMCAMPLALRRGPHTNHWVHVFVSKNARKPMESGEGEYPVGSVILKQKFLDAKGKRTEFFTGMRKRSPGYSPEVGDWEFFTLDATGKKVTTQGKIGSCMNCHRGYAETDYVTRTYLTPGLR